MFLLVAVPLVSSLLAFSRVRALHSSSSCGRDGSRFEACHHPSCTPQAPMLRCQSKLSLLVLLVGFRHCGALDGNHCHINHHASKHRIERSRPSKSPTTRTTTTTYATIINTESVARHLAWSAASKTPTESDRESARTAVCDSRCALVCDMEQCKHFLTCTMPPMGPRGCSTPAGQTQEVIHARAGMVSDAAEA